MLESVTDRESAQTHDVLRSLVTRPVEAPKPYESGIVQQWGKAADGRETVTLADRKGDPVQILREADYPAWRAGKTYVADVARGVGPTGAEALGDLFRRLGASVDAKGQPDLLLVTGRPGAGRAYHKLETVMSENGPTRDWRRWTPPVDTENLTPRRYGPV